MSRTSLSIAEARRTALAAQGFGGTPPPAASSRTLSTGIARLGLLQIDSVSVFERSHYLPLLARLGPYDRTTLDRLTVQPKAKHLEYWAHEAAFIPTNDLPLFRWRMDALRQRDMTARRAERLAATAALRNELLAVLRANGPLAASEIEHDANVRRGPWWGWSDVKYSLEVLFRWGEVVTAGRRGFERVYALPDQILPPGVLETAPARANAVRELVRRSVRALGVGTRADIADYYRLSATETAAALADLDHTGEILPVHVEGWREQAWMHADTRVPRALHADALLSPFDPVVWFRPRAERLFGFHYRIEIYTPAPRRVYGYYVLPVLQDDHVVGRVDLKSDRRRGTLRVRTAWQEPDARLDPDRLALTLRRTATWQGLDTIEVTNRGTAAAAVASALGVPLLPHIAADDQGLSASAAGGA